MKAIFQKILFFIPKDKVLRNQRFELILWAFLLSLSFYSEMTGFLAWVALVRPIAIFSKLSSKEAFRTGFFYGFFLNLFLIYWVIMVTVPGVFGAVFLLASYVAVLFWIYSKVYAIKPIFGLTAFPFLWVGLEYFRTLTEFSFPWSDIGYSQSYYLKIMQIVSVTSVHGLSFIIIIVNILLWQLIRKEVVVERKLTSILVSVALIGGLVSYGWIVMPKYPLPGKVDVVLMQGSVPIEVKWAKGNEWHSFNLYDSLAQTAADTIPKLFVWPETSAPTYLSHNAEYRKVVGQIAKKSGGYHLVGAGGASYKNKKQRYFNSIYQFNPEGQFEQRYDKMKLVPYAEHVPYQDYFPFLQKDFVEKYLTFIKTYNVQWWSDFYPGDSIILFKTPEYEYATLICFESTFPEFSREAILKGASFLVTVTNDTWFGASVGIHMHSRIFLTRAIENRSWGVRVANSGFTYVVDGYGRIRDELELFEVAALQSKINLLDEKSTFTQYGDIIGYISWLITLILFCIFMVQWIIRKFIK